MTGIMDSMKRISKVGSWLVATCIFATVVLPGPVAYADCKKTDILTFPAWYKGVVDSGTCEVNITSVTSFWIIATNILEILIQITGYVAVGYVIWGGIKYIKSQGEPSGISEAKNTIIYALVGLVIALASVAIVRFIQGTLI